MSDVAAPVFTKDTYTSRRAHTKSVGDTFKVSCDALASPRPQILWYKDGQPIDEHVHYRAGRSTLEFSVLGSADAGGYSCRARNLVGERALNFTLDVRRTAGGSHAVVTQSGPNTTVTEGDTAQLECQVGRPRVIVK